MFSLDFFLDCYDLKSDCQLTQLAVKKKPDWPTLTVKDRIPSCI